MKELRFLGDSLKRLRAFPEGVRQDVGYALDRVQRGMQPPDFKSMATIGKGVEEIRIWDERGTFRVIYTVRMSDAVYVLHIFQKKTEATPRSEIELAKKRYSELLRGRDD